MVIDLPDMVCTTYRTICNNDQTLELASRILSPVHQLDYMLKNTPRCNPGVRGPSSGKGGKQGSKGSKGALRAWVELGLERFFDEFAI